MNFVSNLMGRRAGLAGGLAVLLMVAGCATSGDLDAPAGAAAGAPVRVARPDVLRPNDLITVVFSGINNPPKNHEERIKEDGMLTLPLELRIRAEGKSVGQLQKEIHDLYVPDYYKMLTVTVNTENRFFYVSGEVRQPNRVLYSGEMTVTKAIAASGGFTDFGNKKKVRLIRANGQVVVVNCLEAQSRPELDLPVYPGDQVLVKRRVL